MSEWRRTAKTIVTTFLVTSAAWLIGGAMLWQRWNAPVSAPARDLQVASTDPSVAATALVRPGKLVIPVAGVHASELVDTFAQARGGGVRTHDAIDIMAPRGAPVIAAAAGRVEKLFVSALGGNTVYVRSPDRTLIYYYAHLDTYAPGLAAGQAVAAGQRLGTVGSTGDADPAAPHLHFEIQQTTPEAGWWKHTAALNPYPLLMGRR